jgi:hypothetical protein
VSGFLGLAVLRVAEAKEFCTLHLEAFVSILARAEAIAEATKAPVFAITSSQPSVVTDFDPLILGTPVEVFSPVKETVDFVERLPKTEGKKASFSAHARFGKAEHSAF